MPPKAAARAAASAEGTVIYDTVELSAIVAAFREEIITISKDLRNARQRIGEHEDDVTKP